jgi:hypothetical protein
MPFSTSNPFSPPSPIIQEGIITTPGRAKRLGAEEPTNISRNDAVLVAVSFFSGGYVRMLFDKASAQVGGAGREQATEVGGWYFGLVWVGSASRLAISYLGGDVGGGRAQ